MLFQAIVYKYWPETMEQITWTNELQNGFYMWQWIRDIYSVVITRQSNSPIPQFSRLCNEFTSISHGQCSHAIVNHSECPHYEFHCWWKWNIAPPLLNSSDRKNIHVPVNPLLLLSWLVLWYPLLMLIELLFLRGQLLDTKVFNGQITQYACIIFWDPQVNIIELKQLITMLIPVKHNSEF